MTGIRIVIVDDHEVARRGIRLVLQGNSDIQIVGEAVDGQQAIKQATDLQPDILLLDISLPDISGIEAGRQIRKKVPECRIIFVSQHNSLALARDAIAIGAMGYVVKSDAGLELLKAIDAVFKGDAFISHELIKLGWP